MCVVPDGDLFRAIRAGRAAVVTDHIDRFVANGIRLRSGTGAGGRRRGLRDRAGAAADRRHRAVGGRAADRAGGDDRLPGRDALRGAELRLLHRLHQRVLDAAGRPVDPVRCRLLDRLDRRGYAVATPTRRPGPRAARCSGSPPATCNGRSTGSRGRAPTPVAMRRRTTRSTWSGRCACTRGGTSGSAEASALRAGEHTHERRVGGVTPQEPRPG